MNEKSVGELCVRWQTISTQGEETGEREQTSVKKLVALRLQSQKFEGVMLRQI